MIRTLYTSHLSFLLLMALPLNSMNFFKPYNVLLRPELCEGASFQTFVLAETGLSAHGYNSCGNVVNPLQIWYCEQNALTMLDGFCPNSTISRLRERLGDDNGIDGHLVMAANLHYRFGVAIGSRWQIGSHWFVGAYWPFFVFALKDVSIIDKSQDPLVKQLLTDPIKQVALTLGNLCIGSWHRAGMGDLTFLIEWEENFPQARPLLSNVHLFARLGIACPTGRHADPDKLFAFSFGNNGAASMPFGAGIILTGLSHIRLGGDFLLTHIFGNTKTRRVKTSRQQTDLLLLQKTAAYFDWGLTQQFDLFAEVFSAKWGVECRLGYQFEKLGNNHITFATNALDASIANTALSLEDRTSHQIIARMMFDGSRWFKTKDQCVPRLGLYTRIPFNGKRTVQSTTLGMLFSLDF